MGLADYNRQGRPDIPISRNNNGTNANNSSADKQAYIEMVRRANARAEAEKLCPQQPQSAPQARPQQSYGAQQRPIQSGPQQPYGGQPVQRQPQMRPQQTYQPQSQGIYVSQRANQQNRAELQYNAQPKQPSVNFNDLKDEFDNTTYILTVSALAALLLFVAYLLTLNIQIS